MAATDLPSYQPSGSVEIPKVNFQSVQRRRGRGTPNTDQDLPLPEPEFVPLSGRTVGSRRYRGATNPTGPDAMHTDSAAVLARTVIASPAPGSRT